MAPSDPAPGLPGDDLPDWLLAGDSIADPLLSLDADLPDWLGGVAEPPPEPTPVPEVIAVAEPPPEPLPEPVDLLPATFDEPPPELVSLWGAPPDEAPAVCPSALWEQSAPVEPVVEEAVDPPVEIPADAPDFLSEMLPPVQPAPKLSSRRAARDRSGVRHVVFSVADSTYALPLESVREIARMPRSFPVPNTPTWLTGVTNLRGDVLSLVDLGGFLGVGPDAVRADRRLLAVRATREDVFVGLVVDQVTGIRDLGAGRAAGSAAVPDSLAPYVTGLSEADGRLIVVLDADRLLLSPEMRQFERI